MVGLVLFVLWGAFWFLASGLFFYKRFSCFAALLLCILVTALENMKLYFSLICNVWRSLFTIPLGVICSLYSLRVAFLGHSLRFLTIYGHNDAIISLESWATPFLNVRVCVWLFISKCIWKNCTLSCSDILEHAAWCQCFVRQRQIILNTWTYSQHICPWWYKLHYIYIQFIFRKSSASNRLYWQKNMLKTQSSKGPLLRWVLIFFTLIVNSIILSRRLKFMM